MTAAACVHLDLAALRHNLQRARALSAGSRIMAVIKADAYGHGIHRAAQALAEADALAVARIEEALELRHAGIDMPIVLLEGVFGASDLQAAAAHRLQVVVHHQFQLEMLEQATLAQALDVWLKIDTGMHRLGIPLPQVDDVWRRLQACAQTASVRLMTHLASADELHSPQTPQQLANFSAVTAGMQAERSMANSAGLLAWPDSHGDWVRPGIMLYGASPFAERSAADLGLQAVMSLRSRVIAINQITAGEPIGYGASWSCPETMPVGVVACGYGDGYPRHAVVGTPVRIGDHLVPVIGRVSMDTICVDLRGCPAAIGDEVTLWGQGLPVDVVASHASTIPYELLCGITRRVQAVE